MEVNDDTFLTCDGYYFYMGGRGSGRTFNAIPQILSYLLGGTCEYYFDVPTMTHHYLIKNDDIGFMDMTVYNECYRHENIDVRLTRMCEEYDAYMKYKYRDYSSNQERK